MKFLKSLMIVGLAAMTLTSCNDWLDINNDPNTPTSADASLNARCVFMQHYSQAGYMIAASNTTYYCGHLATYTGAQQYAAMNWNIGGSNRANNAQQWFLVPVGGNLPDLYNQAMEKGAYHYAAMACYMKAFGFMEMTDLFGEVPFTEALGDAVAPKYDNGKTIFLGCIDLIDEAIELFQRTQESGNPTLAEGDAWNGGDTGKWLKLCYMLKARWLNRLTKKQQGSYKDGKYDPDAILDCLAKAQQSNADNTVVYHEDNNSSTLDHEGWEEPVDYNTLYSCIGMNNNRLFVTKYFYDNMTNFDGKGIEDPRADHFIPWARSAKSANSPAEIKWSADGKWRRSLPVDLQTNIISAGGPYPSLYNAATAGWYCDTKDEARLGDTVYVQGQAGSTGYLGRKDMIMRRNGDAVEGSAISGVFWTRPTSPTVIGSYAEACMIKAEVLFRKGDKAGAFAAYKEGVKANIDFVNGQLQKWTAEDPSLLDCPSFVPMEQSAINNFLNNALGTAGDITLGKIMTQKQFVVFFTNEMWMDMRRLDYNPEYFMGWNKPFFYENTASCWTYCPKGSYPRRWNQASYETNYNAENLNAIGAEVPGADALATGTTRWYQSDLVRTLPVWWDSTQE